MTDRDVIDAKVDLIDERLTLLREERETFDPDDVDIRTFLAVKHALQETIEACLDIANHVISTEGLGAPTDYSAYFVKLRQADILEADLAGRLQDMARFRNVLVHLYADVETQAVQEILNEDLSDIQAFVQQIYAYLDTAE